VLPLVLPLVLEEEPLLVPLEVDPDPLVEAVPLLPPVAVETGSELLHAPAAISVRPAKERRSLCRAIHAFCPRAIRDAIRRTHLLG